MELYFLALLIILMATALGSGFPVAFSLPGAAILTVTLATVTGYIFTGSPDAFFHSGGPDQWLSAGVTNLRGVYWEVERDTLIAIPLFIFMGIMLQRSKIAEDLLVTMAQLFGPVPGGLGISVVFVGALLAATTGIVGATVVAMGLISLPAMMRNKYSQPLATGTIAASGTLGQIIPPSIVLIILADQLSSAVDQASTARKALYKAATGEITMPSQFDVVSTSAGEMFLGAFVPGLVLVVLYMIFILIYALIKRDAAPAVHNEHGFTAEFYKRLFLALVPPLALIFLVLGSIIAGIATVNQAGAIGAAGALLMASYRLKAGQKRAYWPAVIALVSITVLLYIIANFNTNVRAVGIGANATAITVAVIATAALLFSLGWAIWRTIVIEDTLKGVMIETAKTTSLVFIILMGAAMLTASFRAFGGEDLVREFLNGLPGGFWTKFVIVMGVIFVLGFFLDFIEIAVVVVPIVAPILLADPQANVTAVWLGVMIGLNIQTSFLTPPFGFALFYLRGVAPPSIPTLNIYKGVVPFIALQLLALVIVGLNPPLVNYLPNRISLLSTTAPPPRNPKLQACVEEYVFATLDERGDEIRDGIASIRALDTSYMPDDVAKQLKKAADEAESVFDKVADVRAKTATVDEAAPAYAPVHELVREAERDARALDDDIDSMKLRLSRERGDDKAAEAARAKLSARIAKDEAERQSYLDGIPATWPETQKTFQTLKKAENRALATYRRTADGAYGAVKELVAIMGSGDELVALEPKLDELQASIDRASDAEAVTDQFKDVERDFGEVAGAGEIRSALAKARRGLRGNDPDWAEVRSGFTAARELYDTAISWRPKAKSEALPVLDAFESLIRTNIGLRQQSRLPREQALDVARCSSGHPDLSLSF